MYKPQTVNQFRVWRFLQEQFQMEHIIIAPTSRNALMIEDENGEQLCFAWRDGSVVEQPIPSPISNEEVKAYLQQYADCSDHPRMFSIREMTNWWLQHDTPLSYQQLLGFSDELYRHYLTHPVYTDEQVFALVQKGLVSETEYLGIKLWYLDGNSRYCWLGPLGVDGTGNLYGLTMFYGKPYEERFSFYQNDDYYQHMNKNNNI